MTVPVVTCKEPEYGDPSLLLRSHIADDCPLQDLPETLLHEITKCLDVGSQRNLFRASAQLYKKWRLQISEENHDWHFLSYALNLLEQTAKGYCNMKFGHTFVQAFLRSTGRKADMCCQITDERAQFMMRNMSWRIGNDFVADCQCLPQTMC